MVLKKIVCIGIMYLSAIVGRKFHPRYLPVEFTGSYRYFPAWQISLKWQILANNGKYNFFAVKYWQICFLAVKCSRFL